MGIIAQCGYSAGAKVRKGLIDGVIRGAIASPKDESPERLEKFIPGLRQEFPSSLILFDPQFYAATLNNPRDGHLKEYNYYVNNNGLRRTNFSGTAMRRYVGSCLRYQQSAFGDNLSYVVSPTVLFNDFRDPWSQVSLNLASESVDYHGSELSEPQPLLVSFVVSETAFQNLDAMEEFLDALTELDCAGFYLIIQRNANSPQHAMEAITFGRFLYYCYVLAEINRYEVIVGYSDLHSFLLRAVGVMHTASGWFQNLRQFSLARFQQSTGGRRPRKRYSSTPMLSCPLIQPELEDIFLEGLLPDVLSGSIHDDVIANGPADGEANWNDEISCLAHWYSLYESSQLVTTSPSPNQRILYANRLINNAELIYQQLLMHGIGFDSQTGPNHLKEWGQSIQEFCLLAGIQQGNE